MNNDRRNKKSNATADRLLFYVVVVVVTVWALNFVMIAVSSYTTMKYQPPEYINGALMAVVGLLLAYMRLPPRKRNGSSRNGDYKGDKGDDST